MLKTVYQELYEQRVVLEGMVLKPNMVDRRQEVAASRRRVEEVAEKTIKVLKRCVPSAVPGIAFLSGGQSDEEATAHLDAMNRDRRLPLEADLLLRPRPAGRAAEGLVRQARERRRGAARLLAPRQDEWPGGARAMEERSGEKGRLIRLSPQSF